MDRKKKGLRYALDPFRLMAYALFPAFLKRDQYFIYSFGVLPAIYLTAS